MAFLDLTGLTYLVSLIKEKFLPASGDAGSAAIYTTCGASSTISESSELMSETAEDITVADGVEGTAWTRAVHCTAASPSVTAGDGWVWRDGEAPDLYSGGYLICCWCGSSGVLAYVNTVA